MSLFSDKQLLIVVGVTGLGLYLLARKVKAVVGEVVEKVNPLDENSFFAEIPGVVRGLTQSNEFSDGAREWWQDLDWPWESQRTPPIFDGESAPDIIGHRGDLPVVDRMNL